MQMPFKIDGMDHEFEAKSSDRIADIMDRCRDLFADLAEKNGKNLELQIYVVWNLKD